MDMTLDKRTRISDGTAMCDVCGDIIEQGEIFVTESLSVEGKFIPRDMCRSCIVRGERSDIWSWVIITIGAIASIAALSAWCMAIGA